MKLSGAITNYQGQSRLLIRVSWSNESRL